MDSFLTALLYILVSGAGECKDATDAMIFAFPVALLAVETRIHVPPTSVLFFCRAVLFIYLFMHRKCFHLFQRV